PRNRRCPRITPFWPVFGLLQACLWPHAISRFRGALMACETPPIVTAREADPNESERDLGTLCLLGRGRPAVRTNARSRTSTSFRRPRHAAVSDHTVRQRAAATRARPV